MKKNPVAAYADAEKIGTVELAKRLGVVKGYACELRRGTKPVSVNVARRLAELTGTPWWKYLPAQSEARV